MSAERSDEYDRLIAENERFADQLDRSRLRPAPLTGLVILTCMDARIVVEDIFGFRAGDVNVIRNAGAVASDDAIRSLVLSQQLLGTSEVVVLGHTGCGLQDLDDEAMRQAMERQSGQATRTHFGSFHELDDHVRRQLERIRSHPWVKSAAIHGLVYEVETGRVREVV